MDSGSVWLCGDVHGDLRTIKHALARTEHKPRAILLLGDLEAQCPVADWLASAIPPDIDTWFIHGNHDTDSEDSATNLFDAAGNDRNLDGRVVDLGGLRVAGMGGIFREKIWRPPDPAAFPDYEAYVRHLASDPHDDERDRARRDGLARKHRSSIFPDVYDRLGDLSADLLLVHEAPSCHPHGFEAIDVLAQVMGVRWVAHGHHHDALDYTDHVDRLGFRPIGVGLRGITTLAGEVIVKGERDDARAARMNDMQQMQRGSE